MNWGTMSLGWNPNVSKRWVFLGLASVSLWIGSGSAWAKVPYSDSEFRAVETSEESQIAAIRKQEIHQLRITLGRRLPGNRMADLYFRLAEIYLEAYRAAFLLEGRAHEKRLEHGSPDPFIDRTHSRPYLSAGIQASEEILKFRIHFDKMDQVYYFLGFYHGELDQAAESAKYFGELVHKFPGSPFAAPAYKELGDYHYRKADYRTALGFFQAGLKKAKEETWPPVLHKIAWCQFRTKQYDRAIETMKDAIARASRIDRFKPLKDEALRDMAVLMTDGGHVEEAIRYFQEVAGDQHYFPNILEKLGGQYERNVDLPKAIQVYETLLKTKPESDEAFRVFVKLVELDLKQGHFPKAIQRLGGLNTFTPKGSAPETLEAVHNLRAMIRKTATASHQNFRKKGDRIALQTSEAFYTAYWDYFLKKEDPNQELSEIQMYLAEVKRELGKPNEAVQLYRQVIQSPSQKKFSKEAAQLWIASLIEAMKKTGASHSSGDAPSDLEKQFVEASDLMQTGQGDTQETRESSLRSAQILAGYSSTRGEAIQRIRALIARIPRTAQALTAAKLWVQLAQDQKPISKVSQKSGDGAPVPLPGDELKQVITEIQANAELMKADETLGQGKLKNAFNQIHLGMKVDTIARQEKNQDFVSAAKGYEDVANSTGQRDVVEKAYANALDSWVKAGASNEAIRRLVGIWTKRYPKSPKAMDAFRTVATHALIQGDFDFSAQTFETIGTHFSDPDALETAAKIEEGTGKSDQSIRLLSRYLELFRNSDSRWRIGLSLALQLEKTQADSEASKYFRFCSTGPSPFKEECTARWADLYMKDKNIERAKEVYRSLAGASLSSSGPSKSKGKAKGKQVSSSGGGGPYVGYARYRLAEFMENEATFEPLRLPEAQLQKALGQRLNYLEPLSRSYQGVVEAGGPWAVAALHRIALWALHFADDVDAIEPPTSIRSANPEKVIEKFKKDLASVSGPLREKARGLWSQAYSKAVSISLFTPALPEVADALSDLNTAHPSPGSTALVVPVRAQGPKPELHLAGAAVPANDEKRIMAIQSARDRLLKSVKDARAWLDYGNLLWAEGKIGIARLAFERALALNSKNPAALNNLGVLKIREARDAADSRDTRDTPHSNDEDWVAVAEGARYFEEALRLDDFFVEAKLNLATLLNYYRNFQKAKGYWDQVVGKSPSAESYDGLGVASQGLGGLSAAESNFQKATDLGSEGSRFVAVYHEAARYSIQGGRQKDSDAFKHCFKTLNRLEDSRLSGFEKQAVQHLRKQCEEWSKKD